MARQRSQRLRPDEAVLVVGLGRFGSAVADALTRSGHDVLGVDSDAEIIASWADRLAHVVQADTTHPEVLDQLGASEFRVAVVGIGTNVEASLLTTLGLLDAGVPEVWAKAVNPAHGRILSRVGAQHVVYPEASMGQRVAHLLAGTMEEFIEFDDGFAIAKMRAPSELIGRTLGESRVRSKYGVTIVGVKSPGQDFTYAQMDTPVQRGDLLIVAGHTDQVERFAARTNP